MTALPANVTTYRDRHGKQRWRYRKGDVHVQLPGQPGDQEFDETAAQAAAGLLRQSPRRAAAREHPARQALLAEFASEVIGKAKHRARRKQIPFNITANDVRDLMVVQDWRCAISGIRFLERKRSSAPFRPSLDRIKPADGYVKGNVRIVAFIVNVAMNQWGQEALWCLVEAMSKRLEGSQPSENILNTKDP